MEYENVLDVLKRKCGETSDYLIKQHVELDPAKYHKAQGMNDVYISCYRNMCDIDEKKLALRFLKRNMDNRIEELNDMDDQTTIQKQQGRIEALGMVISLTEEKPL